MGAPPPADPAEPGEAEPAESEGLSIPKTEPAAAPAPADGQDPLAPFRAEWAEKGELSDDSYDKLAKLGYSRDIVDQ